MLLLTPMHFSGVCRSVVVVYTRYRQVLYHHWIN